MWKYHWVKKIRYGTPSVSSDIISGHSKIILPVSTTHSKNIPLDGEIAVRAGYLQEFHGDPTDCLIVTTALQTSSTLMTAD